MEGVPVSVFFNTINDGETSIAYYNYHTERNGKNEEDLGSVHASKETFDVDYLLLHKNRTFQMLNCYAFTACLKKVTYI